MNSNPLVSYIIPSYNHACYIEKAIESVLRQSYSPIELVIVDDGSKDGTRELLAKYQGRSDIIVVFNEKNLRQSATVNKALKLIRGEFVGFLPSDDWLLPDKTTLQMEKFSQVAEKVGVIYGKGARFFQLDDGSDKLIETDYLMHRGIITEKLLKQGNFVYPITPLFRRECFDRYPFDESYTAEGEAIYLKISLSFQFDFVDEVVGVMRDHAGNTGKMTDLMYQENLRYLTEFFLRSDIPLSIKALKNQSLAWLKRIKAMEMIVTQRDYRKGRKLALEALTMQAKYLFDGKLLVAILLTYLPKYLVDNLLVKFYRRKASY